VTVKELEKEKQKTYRMLKEKKTGKVMNFNDIGDDPYVMKPKLQFRDDGDAPYAIKSKNKIPLLRI